MVFWHPKNLWWFIAAIITIAVCIIVNIPCEKCNGTGKVWLGMKCAYHIPSEKANST